MKGLLVFVSALILMLEASALSITSEIDTNQIMIGEQVNFKITVNQKANELVVYPKYLDTIMNKVEIISSSISDTLYVDDETFQVQMNYLVTSFDSGAYMLPVGPFVFKKDQVHDTIFGESVFLSVNTVDINPNEDFKDIKMPIKAPFEFAELYPILKIVGWIVLGLLVLAGIAYGIYKFMPKETKLKEIVQEAPPKDPPHEIAYRELEKLKNEALWQSKQYKEYYTRLTDILRTYIEDKFQVPALESTSDEILRTMKMKSVVDFASLEILEQVLRTADLTKFAKAQPDDSHNQENLSLAYDFVSRTKMVVEPGMQTVASTHVDASNNGLNDEKL